MAGKSRIHTPRSFAGIARESTARGVWHLRDRWQARVFLNRPRTALKVGACQREDREGSFRLVSNLDCMAVLKALGEENRLRIMRLLLREPLSVGAVAEALGLSEYNVSKHLRVLKEAGLLEMEKAGQQRLYGVAPGLGKRLAANRNVLELDCCTFRFDRFPD